jgi:hypothetical protein
VADEYSDAQRKIRKEIERNRGKIQKEVGTDYRGGKVGGNLSKIRELMKEEQYSREAPPKVRDNIVALDMDSAYDTPQEGEDASGQHKKPNRNYEAIQGTVNSAAEHPGTGKVHLTGTSFSEEGTMRNQGTSAYLGSEDRAVSIPPVGQGGEPGDVQRDPNQIVRADSEMVDRARQRYENQKEGEKAMGKFSIKYGQSKSLGKGWFVVDSKGLAVTKAFKDKESLIKAINSKSAPKPKQSLFVKHGVHEKLGKGWFLVDSKGIARSKAFDSQESLIKAIKSKSAKPKVTTPEKWAIKFGKSKSLGEGWFLVNGKGLAMSKAFKDKQSLVKALNAKVKSSDNPSAQTSAPRESDEDRFYREMRVVESGSNPENTSGRNNSPDEPMYRQARGNNPQKMFITHGHSKSLGSGWFLVDSKGIARSKAFKDKQSLLKALSSSRKSAPSAAPVDFKSLAFVFTNQQKQLKSIMGCLDQLTKVM